jgi:Cytochrome c oxidase caa3 assembly factor (Caa3_CtaG)
MEHMPVMDVFNVVFLIGGCLYWWPIVGLDPIVHWRMGYGTRLASLALAVPFEAFLGIAIMSQRTAIASMYTLSSTHSGGALLWALTEFATFIGLIPVFVQWMRAEERAGARADARADRATRVKERTVVPDVGVPDVGVPDVGVPDVGVTVPAAAFTAYTSDGPLTGPGPRPRSGSGPGSGSPTVDRFRPLFQPGNSAWEAMWRAKAGFVPSTSRPAGNQDETGTANGATGQPNKASGSRGNEGTPT